MIQKILILFASSRNNGDMMQTVQAVFGDILENTVNNIADIELIDLATKNITHYDYENKNQADDFIPIAQKMTKADVIIFATPVYWYSMSGILKVFFDRFTDLITIRKDIGRALAGKKSYLISCGSDTKIPNEFEKPFQATCKYLNIDYKEAFYYSTGNFADDSATQKETQNINAIAFGKKILEG